MADIESFLAFLVGARTFALPVRQIKRIVAAVAVSPLTEPHPVVAGVINVGGEGILLYDLRRLYGEPTGEIKLDDRFLIVSSGERVGAMWVDEIIGVMEMSFDSLSLPGEEGTNISMAFDKESSESITILSLEGILDQVKRFKP